MTMAGNRAIHQLPEVTSLQDGDLFVIARPSGGSFVDRSIDATGFPQQMQFTTVTVPAASVLTLGTTPFTLIAAPAAGQAIFVKAALMSMLNGSIDYATSTNLNIGAVAGTGYLLLDISTASSSPWIASGGGGTIVDGASTVLTAGGVNPTAGDYDLEIQLWYITITL